MVIFTNKILKEAENQHYNFQIGCYFSDSKKNQGCTFLWSKKIKDSYWNYATKINTDEKLLQKLIKQIIDFYKTKNRQPAIYFTPFTIPKDLPNLIKKFGFQSKYKDAWMFYEKTEPKVVMPQKFVIKPVETKEEMKIFVDIFNQCYSGATPEEPYGALPKEYGECLLDSFTQQKDSKIIHYLGLFDKKIVGITTLISYGNYGCIYNVGTIPIIEKKRLVHF